MTTTLIYPYTTLDQDVLLRISNARIDGDSVDGVLDRSNAIDLHHVDTWKRLTARISVQVPADLLSKIATDPRIVCTVHCGPTNLRYAIALNADQGRPGSYSGELELEHSMLHCRGRIEAVVAGTVDGIEDRYIGRSNGIEVNLDQPRVPEIAGDLDISWRDFREQLDGAPPIDASLHDQPAWIELDRQEGPRLWLNSAVEGLQRLLDDTPGRSHVERALRDTVFDSIAAPALAAMFATALAAAAEGQEGDEIPWPEDWRQGVLRSLLPLMYPDRSVDDALVHVIDDSRDMDGVADVQSRLHAATAQYLKTTTHARDAVRAIERNDP
jgi:hypothetical protein